MMISLDDSAKNNNCQENSEVNQKFIPSELKNRKQWICWIYGDLQENGKRRKIPINADTGKAASPTGPGTWTTFFRASNYFKSGLANGIGFVLGKEDSFVGIDIDECRDLQSGEIDARAQEILRGLKSYTEISPSQTGIHIIALGKLPGKGRKFNMGGLSIEIYDQKRFFTVTGQRLEEYPIEALDRQAEILELYQRADTEKLEVCAFDHKLTKEDKALLDKMFNSKHGAAILQLWEGDWSDYPSQSEADLALSNHLGYWTNFEAERTDRLFRNSGLYRHKWKRQDYREATIRKALQSRSHETTLCVEDVLSNEALPGLVDFPDDVMTGAAGEFARIFSGHLEPPVHFFFLSYLTCLGSLLANCVTLESEIRPQPRLYTILLGESAEVRKSTAIVKTVEFFQNAASDFAVSHGVGSAEGFQRELKKHSCLLLILDELKQFVSKARIQHATLLPCVNTLFELNHYSNRTKHSDVMITGAHLSLLAASTTLTYETIWDQQFLAIGFTNRLLIVPGSGERKFPITQKISEEDILRLRRELMSIIALVGPGLE